MFLEKGMRLPTYPLLVKDPYFSIWSKTDKLNDSNTIFWHGEEKPIYGYLVVDGKKYCFMGLAENVAKLTQVGVEVTALATKYYFKENEFSFEVEFLSPLTLSNLTLLACPVCYINYSFESEKNKDIEVQIIMHQDICYNTSYENVVRECRANRFELDSFECVSVALERQLPLSLSNDEDGADWGTYYLTGEKCEIINEDAYIKLKAINRHRKINKVNSTFLIGFDDVVSIYYYGQFLKGYYFTKTNKTIFEALEESYVLLNTVKETCDKENRKLEELASNYSKETLLVLIAGYRQSIGAHKLVEDYDHNILFLSKECNSDGCIATVDITYPSMPLYLLLNPQLVKGMLLPIFKFARFPIWKFDYAPHDAGIYPYCLGQYYAIQSNKEKQLDIHVHDWHKATVLPFYYQFPRGTEIYTEERQMPVEESGNMLIAACLYSKVSKDLELIKQNYDLLEKWVVYLVNNGLKPTNQLCTDDFAGHISGNANLAIKAIVGINAFAEINEMIGNQELADKYYNIAKDYAKKWVEIYDRKDCSILALEQENTYSLKYNLALDCLIGEPLFNEELREKEVSYYLTRKNRYGIPLDTRNTYTKTDWMAWVTCLTKDYTKREEIFKCMFDFICETTDRVPFSDWIFTIEPKYSMFRNRTVQGGLFLPILIENWSKLCQK